MQEQKVLARTESCKVGTEGGKERVPFCWSAWRQGRPGLTATGDVQKDSSGQTSAI